MVPLICIGLVLASIAALALWILSMRREAALSQRGESRHDLALKAAVQAYAAKRGASVTFDGLTMAVKGPRGEGTKMLHTLKVMCPLGDEARWEPTIGFTLREFIPDAMDERMAQLAGDALSKVAPQIAALSEEELRSKLRVSVLPIHAPAEGLVTCARPITKRFGLRLVLDGYDLEGVPNEARARLSESDEALMAQAMSQTVSSLPSAADGAVKGPNAHVWLSRMADIFGTQPHVIVAEGQGLRWTPATPEQSEERLIALARAAQETGRMKGVMWAWDGQQLHESTIMNHTIMGPNTPDYTLTLPIAMHPLMGVQASSDGTFGVKRRR